MVGVADLPKIFVRFPEPGEAEPPATIAVANGRVWERRLGETEDAFLRASGGRGETDPAGWRCGGVSQVTAAISWGLMYQTTGLPQDVANPCSTECHGLTEVCPWRGKVLWQGAPRSERAPEVLWNRPQVLACDCQADPVRFMRLGHP